MPRILISLLAAVLVFSSPLAADNGDEKKPKKEKEPPTLESLEAQSQEALENEKWVRLYVANRKLEKMRPYEPEYMINIIKASSMLDRKNTAFHYMLSLQNQGLSYNLDEVPEAEGLRGTEAYTYMNDLMIRAGEPAGDAESAFSLASGPSWTSIAWDGSQERFLFGDENGGVHVADESGSTTELLQTPAQTAVAGMAVDTERNTLWVSAGSLHEYALDSLKLRKSHSVASHAEQQQAGKVTIAQDGHVYAIESLTASVYRKAPGEAEFVQLPTGAYLEKPTDLTLLGEDKRLIISDRYQGLVMVDLQARLPYPMPGPENLNLGGITAMEQVDGKLIILQSAYKPQRLMRLTLDSTGAAIEAMAPMAVAIEEFDGLGDATVQGEAIYYFAGNDTSPGTPSVIMKSPLDAGSDIVPPDQQQMNDIKEGKMKPFHSQ